MPKGKRKRAAASDGSMAVADQADRGRRPCTGGNARPGRKIGHVNILGAAGGSPDDDAYVADVRERAARAAHWLSHAEWTDGWSAHAYRE